MPPDFSLDFSPDFATAVDIVFLASGDLGHQSTGNNLLAPFTVPDGPNRCLVLAIVAINFDITNVQYNGVSCRQAATTNVNGQAAYLYTLLNPPIGTFNVSIITATTEYIQCLAAVYAGVSQVGQYDNAGTANDTIVEITYSQSGFGTIRDNCTIVAYAVNAGGGVTPPTTNAPYTVRVTEGASHNALIADYGPVHPHGTTTLAASIHVGGLGGFKQSQLFVSLKPFIQTLVKKPPGFRRLTPHRKRLPRRRLLPLPLIKPARFIAWRRRPARWLRARRTEPGMWLLKKHVRYPTPAFPIVRYNQGIAFRATSGFVVDATFFDFGLFSTTATTYPQITRQRAAVGFTNFAVTTIGQDQLNTQDHRIAGNLLNKFLTLTVSPPAPQVPDTTPKGATVATLTALWSDASVFTGSFVFVAPNFDDGGIFAISGNNLIVNPNGGGIPAGGTVANVSIEAMQ